MLYAAEHQSGELRSRLQVAARVVVTWGKCPYGAGSFLVKSAIENGGRFCLEMVAETYVCHVITIVFTLRIP